MAKFHINKKGVPALCRAKDGNCPFGGGEKHFDNKEQAQQFIDKKNEKEHGLLASNIFTEEKKKKDIRKLIKVLENNGFDYYDESDLADVSELELTQKASGDGHESYTMNVFGDDYDELKRLTEELNISLPDTVWND